jgi:hypothetical protein
MSTPVPGGGLDGGGAGVGGVVVLDGKRVMSPVWAMRIAAHTAPIPNSSVSDVDDAATAASTRRFESRRAVSIRRGAHRRQRSYGDGLTPSRTVPCGTGRLCEGPRRIVRWRPRRRPAGQPSARRASDRGGRWSPAVPSGEQGCSDPVALQIHRQHGFGLVLGLQPRLPGIPWCP